MFNLMLLLMLKFSFADVTTAVDSYFYYQRSQVADSVINPGNRIFKLPESEYNADIRPEFKWKNPDYKLVVRPRLIASSKNIEGQDSESKSELQLTDAFFENTWSPNVATTWGLQVYQWGPAEAMNPSNPLYHFNSKQRSLLYKEKGQVLIRTNFSFGKEHSVVAILQPVSNNEPEWIAEDEFKPKLLLKYEKSWEGTPHYLGFVAGTEEKGNPFFGEYFNYSPAEGFSIYADIKQAQSHINFGPEFNGTSYDMVSFDDLKNSWPSLGIFGIRWEDSCDVRAEYIYNGMGNSRDQLASAVSSAGNFMSPSYATNLSRFLKPGLELPGQNYLYFSYRINEPFKLKETNFYARYIHSLQDESSQLQIEADRSFLDSFQLFSSFSTVYGDLDTETRLLNDWQLIAGFKWGL